MAWCLSVHECTMRGTAQPGIWMGMETGLSGWGALWAPQFGCLRPGPCPSTAETCSTTEDGAEPLLCPSGYECHILQPGDEAQGIPNHGQCVKQRRQAGERCWSKLPWTDPNPLAREHLVTQAWLRVLDPHFLSLYALLPPGTPALSISATWVALGLISLPL